MSKQPFMAWHVIRFKSLSKLIMHASPALNAFSNSIRDRGGRRRGGQGKLLFIECVLVGLFIWICINILIHDSLYFEQVLILEMKNIVSYLHDFFLFQKY